VTADGSLGLKPHNATSRLGEALGARALRFEKLVGAIPWWLNVLI
jgi:hypothetical protein